MTPVDLRRANLDRRRVPRGGRRTGDLPGRYPSVLVADSYDGARIPCAKYLDRFNFGVIEAGGGHEALAHIDAMAAQVILIENGLLHTPVLRIARRLSRSGSAVPLIVMTTDLDTVEETVAGLPLVSVLEKPFSLSKMLEEIRRLLRIQMAAGQLPDVSGGAGVTV